MNTAHASQNPFFATWTAPFAAPPFDAIKPEHFRPAFDRAMAEHEAEIAAIAGNTAPADFANTIVALENSARALKRVTLAFYHLAAAHTNEALQEIERAMAPLVTRHWNAIYQNEAVFRRIDTLKSREATLGLSPEEMRVLERYHLDYVRAGAKLSPADKAKMSAITERLSTLGTQFGQNVLADESGFTLALDGETALAGLPDFVREAAAAAAKERGLDASHAITLGRSSVEPFLQFSDSRELREKAFRAWTARGENGDANDNRAIIAEMVKLRIERARLLGYRTFADFKLDDTMAKTPAAARGLLEKVWEPAKKQAMADRNALQELVQAEGHNFKLAPWDWRYYAEKLRKARYDLDEAEVKPFLQLDRMIEAQFYTATRLFGVTFRERHDVPVWHPDVRVWEVTAADGSHVGLFYGDYFARPSKRSGAWMDAVREQERLSGDVRPIVFNVCNFVKGDPALLSFDDARTLFHEFGHGLHGLLSNVTYPAVAGTNVARDFVELPSQIFEHWLSQPEVLQRFAVHYRTGEAMPKALIDKVIEAQRFNQGFMTVEAVSSGLVDLAYHALESADDLDIAAFERETLESLGMPEEIAMRHRSTHFQHVFAGDGYSAGYYSYLWAEVLDADGFKAFKEAGDVFDAATAKRLLTHIYAAGGSRDPAELYRAFRGRDPHVDALLEGRGLLDDAA